MAIRVLSVLVIVASMATRGHAQSPDGSATSAPDDGPATSAPDDGPATSAPDDGPATSAPDDGSATSTAEDGSAASTPEDERARALFDEGVGLVESGRPEEALVVFENAFTLAPRASTAYNIAWVLFSLGRARAALYALDRAEPFAMSDAERDSIDALRARLRPELATVVVHVSPSSATVCVDDACDTTTATVRTIVVDEGFHRVTCTAEQHELTETTLTSVAGSTARVEFSLVRLPDVPTDLLLDRRQATARRRRVRRASGIASGIAAALAAGMLAAFLPRDEESPYSGIDFGVRP